MLVALVVLFLAVAIPGGILAFSVLATQSKNDASDRRSTDHALISRGGVSLVFGLAAFLGVAAMLWVWTLLHQTEPVDEARALGLLVVTALPVMAIAALIAALGYRLLVCRSAWGAALSGGVVTILTVLASSLVVALLIAPNASSGLAVVIVGTVSMLFHFGIPLLFIGMSAGILVNRMSRPKRLRSQD